MAAQVLESKSSDVLFLAKSGRIAEQELARERKNVRAPAAFLHPTQDTQGHSNSHTAAKHWVTQ